MRILHVTPTYLPATRYGGPIRSVHGLCTALAQRGHQVDVFTTNVDGNGDSDVPLETPVELDGTHVWYFQSKRLRRLYWSPPMGRALKDRVGSYDIAHIHALYLWPTWAASRAARGSAVPYVLAPRGMLIKGLIRRKRRWLKSAWIGLIDSANIRHAAALQMTTELEVEEAKHFNISLPPIVVVPNGIDLLPPERSPEHAARNASSPRLLFLGRMNWEKGLDRLIPAMRYVPRARLTIAGNDEEGYTQELSRLAEANGVTERIDFAGPVQGERKATLLREADLLVLPSYSESFGIVAIEAMAAMCPVVVTPEVGLAAEVEAAGAGVVSDGAPHALGKTIATLLGDPARRAVMGRRGRETVRAQYTWSAIAKDMERIYETIMSASRVPHPSTLIY